MTDKQIIIDGVDVSKCEHAYISTSLFEEETYAQCSAFFLENEDSYCECKENPNCYYKQLKRAEQKLEKIKKVCNKFIPDHYKILLIINGGIIEE